MIPAALVAAPAIGGAIGVSYLGLSGVAATNAGLALLGGGSLTAGGMGMAGGVAVISASGAALGGVLGGVVSNSYFGDIEGFKIEKLVDGGGPAVIAIDGFLCQGQDAPHDWISSLKRTHVGKAIYYVRWENKRLTQIAQLLGGRVSQAAVASLLKGIGKKASKSAASSLGPAGVATTISSIASNPWSVAMVKAEMTGALLADIICRTKSQFVICGHSLGGRVAHFAMLALARKPGHRWLSEVHLMGGAVGNDPDSWKEACKSVSNGVFNYHSDRDDVLKYLYAAGTVFRSSPVGRFPINDVDEVVNVDVTDTVGGHSEYKSNFPFIRRHQAAPGKKPGVGTGDGANG